MTALMAALLAAADGLDAPGGRLVGRAPRDDAALQALVHRAVANPPRAGAARIGRPSGRASFVVTAYPLPRRHRLLAPAEAAALVIVVDPAAPAAGASHLHRKAFGLTPREADLAALLMAGHSVESAAASLVIALPTARTHLRGLMTKAGVTRQAELVGLLSRIG